MSHSPPEGQESSALLGYGSFFQVEDTSSPGVFNYIAEVTNITPPAFTVDQVDVTHMQSPGRIREFISGLIDPGESSFEMNFVPGSESDILLFDWMNTPITELRRRTCRVIFPPVTGGSNPGTFHWEFSGEITGYEPELPTDDKATAAVTIKVTGTISTNYT